MALPLRNLELTDDRFRRRHYRKPPVIEAVIDLKVRAPRPPSFEALAQIVAGEEAQYPTRHSISTEEFTIEVGKGASASTQQLIGYRFASATNDAILQARLDGFAFSRLTPYRDWEVWQPEARRIWDRYRELVEPTHVTRIAVRYINRVVLPRSAFTASDYFNCFPELPTSFGAPNAFVMRVEIPQSHFERGMLVFSQGILADPSPETMPILLDFDLFRMVDLRADDPNLWSLIEELHTHENFLFENSITQRTRDLFDAIDG